jgi:hypothetical protein
MKENPAARRGHSKGKTGFSLLIQQFQIFELAIKEFVKFIGNGVVFIVVFDDAKLKIIFYFHEAQDIVFHASFFCQSPILLAFVFQNVQDSKILGAAIFHLQGDGIAFAVAIVATIMIVVFAAVAVLFFFIGHLNLPISFIPLISRCLFWQGKSEILLISSVSKA